MKKLFIILPWLIMFSCNNLSGSGNTSDAPKSDATSTSSQAGKGTITCLLDGKQKAFTVDRSYFEIPLGVDPNGPKDGLEILNGNIKKEGFEFECKKSGTSKIKDDASGDMNCIINYYNPQGITYTGEDVTVVITSYDQTHLTGTFSGKLVNTYYEEKAAAKNYPQYIQVTDGKFDLRQ